MDYNFRTSCCVLSDLCVFYSDVRPSDNCIGYRPQRIGMDSEMEFKAQLYLLDLLLGQAVFSLIER